MIKKKKHRTIKESRIVVILVIRNITLFSSDVIFKFPGSNVFIYSFMYGVKIQTFANNSIAKIEGIARHISKIEIHQEIVF